MTPVGVENAAQSTRPNLSVKVLDFVQFGGA